MEVTTDNAYEPVKELDDAELVSGFLASERAKTWTARSLDLEIRAYVVGDLGYYTVSADELARFMDAHRADLEPKWEALQGVQPVPAEPVLAQPEPTPTPPPDVVEPEPAIVTAPDVVTEQPAQPIDNPTA